MASKWVVYCRFDTTAQCPGTFRHSEHETQGAAEAEKARMDAEEQVRRSRTRLTRSEARRVAEAHCGESRGNKAIAIAVHDAMADLLHQRQTEYVIEEVSC